ncbi:MAG: tRNA (adenosine(37)-N6)-threonylcarbamoyltransferase complex dimerization subunit type 1 TsaB, partial [Pseudomonadota bacterium]|nr:tRNA (adenosine(37)-N6)-threonylcarbamoyltransferase complex dimerization subunit type 1 TsaB [Pseudomonadota bacterium]
TANDQCSVALYAAGQVLAFRQDTRPREQTRVLLPMIDQVLAEVGQPLSALQAIAFSRGPGSFSGVRINAAVTQGLAWANDLPVIAVSTLQAVAQAAYRQLACEQVMAVLDARMSELYAAAYQIDAGLMQLVGVEQLAGYAEVQWPESWPERAEIAVVGSGAQLLHPVAGAQEWSNMHPKIMPTAIEIAQLGWAALQAGQTVSAADALPVYLRDDAWKKIADQGRPI